MSVKWEWLKSDEKRERWAGPVSVQSVKWEWLESDGRGERWAGLVSVVGKGGGDGCLAKNC